MLPRHNAYGGWPASGEIDIVESRGNRDFVVGGQQIGSQLAGCTLHWGPDYFTNRYEYTHWETRNSAGFDNDFHIYEMLWTPDSITFYIDGNQAGHVQPPAGGFWELGNLGATGWGNPWRYSPSPMAPFDQEFYFLINNAVGGVAYFPDGGYNGDGPKPWANPSGRVR